VTVCVHAIYRADCNDVGLSVPCLLPGFWRPPGEAQQQEEKGLGGGGGLGYVYSVYGCDVFENCVGGCVFNESCKSGVSQSSPTCGE
jgi:hypothetical protein